MADGAGPTYADGGEVAIPSSNRPAQCPDCWHPAHFTRECRCGCPDGITRKRQRDAEHVAAHGDAARPAEGFY